MPDPSVSVIVTTFDRPVLARRAIAAVADQRPRPEVVVVDDGSTADTAGLRSFVEAGGHHFVWQPNQGLSVARNTGARMAQGEWLAFVDDDDEVQPGWLSALTSLVADDVGLVSCAAQYRAPDGSLLHVAAPHDLGPAYDRHTANVLAGCFLVRSDLYWRAGGYTPGLRCSHQTELALRLLPLLTSYGLRSVATSARLVLLDRREPTDRPMSSPAALLDGAKAVLRNHRSRLARDPAHLAGFHSVAGTSAARLGDWREARAQFRAAVMVAPRDPRVWVRAAVSLVPPIGRRVWRTSDYTSEEG